MLWTRRRCCAGVVVAIAAPGLIAVPTVTSPTGEVRAVRLVDSANSLLGDGTALVIGGSGIPLPPESYVDAADTLYLAPRGFTGSAQPLDTPEGFYPTTGVNTLTADASEVQGSKILDAAILGQIGTEKVDADNPVVVFGYSQSSAFTSMTMQQLESQGVPSDDVHFVLVGDTAAPDGGLLERFDLPGGFSVPSFGITFGDPTPSDLYPTDIYTLEYDGFADFPQYPIDPIADLNAFAGMIYEHLTYLGVDADQIKNAVPLDTVGDTLTNYYMIPVNDLPLLDPLRLIPVVGNPLADLLQPDLKVLVNLGYGSITDGWSQGPANVPTPFELFPADISVNDVASALVTGVSQGIQGAIADLENPDNYQIPSSLLDNPIVGSLVEAAYTSGLIDTLQPTSQELTQALLGGSFPLSDATLLSPPADIINDLSATVSADYAALLPIADTVSAFTTSLPLFDISVFMDQLEAGNLIAAIGDPIAADVALVPFALFLGLGPIGDAVEGTLLNITGLIP